MSRLGARGQRSTALTQPTRVVRRRLTNIATLHRITSIRPSLDAIPRPGKGTRIISFVSLTRRPQKNFSIPPSPPGRSPPTPDFHDAVRRAEDHNRPLLVLAVGFLLVILSCALWKVYYPLLVVGTYVLAPVPNWICGRCANPDDFVESSGAAVLDLGRFCTGFFVVMGIGT